MTRKDFELVAFAIRSTDMPQRYKVRLALRLIQLLADDNGRFDRERFLQATQRKETT